MSQEIIPCRGQFNVANMAGNATSVTVECEKRFTCLRYIENLRILVSSRRLPINKVVSFDAEECIDLEHEYYLPTI